MISNEWIVCVKKLPYFIITIITIKYEADKGNVQ